MDVSFKNKKLAKTLNEGAQLERIHGARQAKLIRSRMAVLRAAESLSDFKPYTKPERCHELDGDRAGQLAMDLDHPYRLIFTPAHDPVPTREDGGLDWSQVTAIRILGVEDYHG